MAHTRRARQTIDQLKVDYNKPEAEVEKWKLKLIFLFLSDFPALSTYSWVVLLACVRARCVAEMTINQHLSFSAEWKLKIANCLFLIFSKIVPVAANQPRNRLRLTYVMRRETQKNWAKCCRRDVSWRCQPIWRSCCGYPTINNKLMTEIQSRAEPRAHDYVPKFTEQLNMRAQKSL